MNRINKEAAILLGVLLTALALRLYTYGYEYLMGVDPFHHYKIAEYIVMTDEFPERWHLSRYPEGELIVQPMGLYYVSVLLYKIFGPLGFTFIQVFKLVPPLFGIMTLLPAYFLTKELFGRKTAIFSVLILSFLPAFTYRTMSGFYRGDAFFMFFMVLGLYFYLKSLDNPRLAIIAGISFGLMGLVWNGFIFGFIVLSGFVVLHSLASYVRGTSSRNAIISYIISAVIGIGIIKYLVIIPGYQAAWFMQDLTRYMVPGTIVFSGLLEILGFLCFSHTIDYHEYSSTRRKPTDELYGTDKLMPRTRVLHVLGILMISLATALYVYPELMNKMLGGYGLVKGDGWLGTIGELHPPALQHLWEYFPITFLLFLWGAVFLLRAPRPKTVIIAAWVLAGLYVLSAAIRYTFLASIPIGIVAALFLSKLDKTTMKARQFMHKTRILQDLGKLIIPLIPGILLLTVTFAGIQFAASNTPTISDEWYEAISSLKTQEPGTVLTWWDYGSWVQGITGYPTVTDTVHGQDANRMRETARIFLETNESVTLKALQKYDTKYVIIDVTMIGQMKNIRKVGQLSIMEQVKRYQYSLFLYSGEQRVFGAKAADYSDLFVLDTDDGKMVLHNRQGKVKAVKSVYWREKDNLRYMEYDNVPTTEGTVYIPEKGIITHFPDDDFIIYIPPDLEDTFLTSLMLLDGKGFDKYELIFKNSQVRIYKIN